MVDSHTSVVSRFWEEIFNDGNLAAIDEVFAPGYVLHHLPTKKDFYRDTPHPANKYSFKELIAWVKEAFPAARATVEEHFAADGERVVTRLTLHVPILGQGSEAMELSAIGISRVSGGQIEDSWFIWEPSRVELMLLAAGTANWPFWPLRW